MNRHWSTLIGFLFIALLMAPVMPASAANPEEIIAKAREYLGGDEVLSSVKSIRYHGSFENADGERGDVEILFEKPYRQRVRIHRGSVVETVVLNGYDAWRKLEDAQNERNWTVILLDPDQIRELRANTWENLNFFKGIESRHGWVENGGVDEVNSRRCGILTFRHNRNIAFTRYFDLETGKLLLTRTAEGGEIREVGEMKVEGIRFPEALVMKQRGEVVNRIEFDEIVVNETFDEDLFEIPSLVP